MQLSLQSGKIHRGVEVKVKWWVMHITFIQGSEERVRFLKERLCANAKRVFVPCAKMDSHGKTLIPVTSLTHVFSEHVDP